MTKATRASEEKKKVIKSPMNCSAGVGMAKTSGVLGTMAAVLNY